MAIEKTTSISIPSIKGKFTFQRNDDAMVVSVVGEDGVIVDSAELTESDLRFLLKDIFPTTRKPRGPNVAKKAANGKSKDKGERVSA